MDASLKLTPPEKASALETLGRALEIVKALPVHTPCASCIRFAADTGFCHQWGDTVPENLREAGCPEWCAEIPF